MLNEYKCFCFDQNNYRLTSMEISGWLSHHIKNSWWFILQIMYSITAVVTLFSNTVNIYAIFRVVYKQLATFSIIVTLYCLIRRDQVMSANSTKGLRCPFD